MEQQERIDQLETRLMQVEDLLEALNLTVFRQQEQLARMVRQLTDLGARVTATTDIDSRGGAADVPPHY
ncbi:MAG: SlyX family protein [Rhodocyclaceae bacterium]|nr:SlyX family protein [Rhodocyclaceae bacterium]